MIAFRSRTLFASVAVILVTASVARAQAADATADGPASAQEHANHTEHNAATPPAGQDHAAHQHAAAQDYPPGLPPITDADRAAAFPALDVRHGMNDDAVHSYVLFDQLEWQAGGGTGGNWNAKGWVGRDLDRLWFRTEGEGHDGQLGTAEAHALYGRAISRWWDLVAGVRQDVRPGPARTWAAVGLQGLAPYFFEVELTGYVGASGRTQVRLETEYELLLTNRLVLQPRLEMDLFGKADPERGVGAGLSSTDAGLRLRYEFRRELAPYVGVSWQRTFFGTADLARAAGEEVGNARLTLGMRVWF